MLQNTAQVHKNEDVLVIIFFLFILNVKITIIYLNKNKFC